MFKDLTFDHIDIAAALVTAEREIDIRYDPDLCESLDERGLLGELPDPAVSRLMHAGLKIFVDRMRAIRTVDQSFTGNQISECWYEAQLRIKLDAVRFTRHGMSVNEVVEHMIKGANTLFTAFTLMGEAKTK